MRVSIAMCSYNGARHIREQLRSIAGQSCLPDELVICDDASTDATVRIIEEARGGLPFPVHLTVNLERAGVIKNFEHAIELCSGDIIFLADQDDVWSAVKVETIAAVFRANPDAGYVFSDAVVADDSLKPLGRLWKSVGFLGVRRRLYERGEQVRAMLTGGPFVYGNTLAFRSRLRGLVLPICDSYPTILGHDSWISFLLSASEHPGVLFSEPLVTYRQHGAQQAGAGRRLSFGKAVDAGLTLAQATYAERADAVEELGRRIGDSNSTLRGLMEAYQRHFRSRARLHDLPRRQRLSTIYRELILGGYMTFSSSWRSVLRDLMAAQP